MATILYDHDYHAWALEQASALRRLAEGRSNLPVDLAHLAEEIEDMGNNELDVVEGNLAQIILHLLKLEWLAETEPRRHWQAEVAAMRGACERKLSRSPTVLRKVNLALVYKSALRQMRLLYGDRVAGLPEQCPYNVMQLLDDDWFPFNRTGIEDDH